MTEITHNFNILCELQLVHMSAIIITCLLPTSTYAHISVQDIVSSTCLFYFNMHTYIRVQISVGYYFQHYFQHTPTLISMYKCLMSNLPSW